MDLKTVNILLGQKHGYTKFPCFFCLWDSRNFSSHYTQKNWPQRETLEVGKENVIANALVPRDRIVFPPLHIKLGLVKQFIGALDKNGECFKYICQVLHMVSYEKLKAGILNGPQIRKLINDDRFRSHQSSTELAAWNAFVDVVKGFLGKNKSPDYQERVNFLLRSFQDLGANMSIKVHFLFSHLDHFPINLSDVSDEHGERFHQDIKTMEERYQGRWNIHMLADYCWCLMRDFPSIKHRRNSRKRTFLPDSNGKFV